MLYYTMPNKTALWSEDFKPVCMLQWFSLKIKVFPQITDADNSAACHSNFLLKTVSTGSVSDFWKNTSPLSAGIVPALTISECKTKSLSLIIRDCYSLYIYITSSESLVSMVTGRIVVSLEETFTVHLIHLSETTSVCFDSVVTTAEAAKNKLN